jgi:YD repeat-containing protein
MPWKPPGLNSDTSYLSGKISDIELQLAQMSSTSDLNDHTFTYVYNTDGSTQSETEIDSNGVVLKTVVYAYTNGQLTFSVVTANAFGQTMSTQYNYDGNGNITSIVNTLSTETTTDIVELAVVDLLTLTI